MKSTAPKQLQKYLHSVLFLYGLYFHKLAKLRMIGYVTHIPV